MPRWPRSAWWHL